MCITFFFSFFLFTVKGQVQICSLTDSMFLAIKNLSEVSYSVNLEYCNARNTSILKQTNKKTSSTDKILEQLLTIFNIGTAVK